MTEKAISTKRSLGCIKAGLIVVDIIGGRSVSSKEEETVSFSGFWISASSGCDVQSKRKYQPAFIFKKNIRLATADLSVKSVEYPMNQNTASENPYARPFFL